MCTAFSKLSSPNTVASGIIHIAEGGCIRCVEVGRASIQITPSLLFGLAILIPAMVPPIAVVTAQNHQEKLFLILSDTALLIRQAMFCTPCIPLGIRRIDQFKRRLFSCSIFSEGKWMKKLLMKSSAAILIASTPNWRPGTRTDL